MSLDGGSEQIEWALRVIAAAPNCGSREFHVLMTLLKHRNRTSGLAWPATETIASVMGVGYDVASRGLSRLRSAGIIRQAEKQKASSGNSYWKYGFNFQPQADVQEAEPAADVREATVQPAADVPEANPQPQADVREAEPQADVQEAAPAPSTFAVQPAADVRHKPLEEPQLPISSLTTTSPVEEWTGPTEQNLAWLAGQVSLKVEGCEIPLDSITEKMLKARKPQMTSGGWTMAALALLGAWQSKADAESTFKNTPSAGEEKPRVREGEWRPKWPDITALFSEYPHLNKQTVRHDITRSYLDWMSGKGEDPSKLPYGRALAGWKTILKSNYEEAIRSLPGERNPQMTGTE